MRSLVERQFGAHAAAYATSNVHAKGASLQRIVDLVRPQSEWRVLDVATGAGHTAATFAPQVASVIAGDLTEEMLAEAAKLAAARNLANMTTKRMDASELPFPDASFDLVTCRIAAHHFPQPARFAAEVARVLVPGGLFALVDNVAPDALTTPGVDAVSLVAAERAYNEFERLRDPSHVRALTASEWQTVLGWSGLRLVHAELMRKEMQLGDWARRLGCDATTIDRLRGMLDEASPALAAFLQPVAKDSEPHFTLTEAILIAVR